RYQAPRGALLTGLPPTSDISSFDVLGTADQGPLGQCTGVSTSQAIINGDVAALVVGGANLEQARQNGVRSSAYALYFWGRYYDYMSVAGASGTFMAQFQRQDSDAGSSHASVCAGISAMGLPPESAWPYDPSYDPANDGPTCKYRLRPDQEAERLGFDNRGELVVLGIDDESQDQRLLDLVHALAVDKHSPLIGVNVSQPFCDEAFDPNVAVDAPSPKQVVGGHALHIVGHRTEADGSISFKVHMSWGEGPFAYVWFSHGYVLDVGTQLTIVKRVPMFQRGGA